MRGFEIIAFSWARARPRGAALRVAPVMPRAARLARQVDFRFGPNAGVRKKPPEKSASLGLRKKLAFLTYRRRDMRFWIRDGRWS